MRLSNLHRRHPTKGSKKPTDIDPRERVPHSITTTVASTMEATTAIWRKASKEVVLVWTGSALWSPIGKVALELWRDQSAQATFVGIPNQLLEHLFRRKQTREEESEIAQDRWALLESIQRKQPNHLIYEESANAKQRAWDYKRKPQSLLMMGMESTMEMIDTLSIQWMEWLRNQGYEACAISTFKEGESIVAPPIRHHVIQLKTPLHSYQELLNQVRQ